MGTQHLHHPPGTTDEPRKPAKLLVKFVAAQIGVSGATPTRSAARQLRLDDADVPIRNQQLDWPRAVRMEGPNGDGEVLVDLRVGHAAQAGDLPLQSANLNQAPSCKVRGSSFQFEAHMEIN